MLHAQLNLAGSFAIPKSDADFWLINNTHSLTGD